METVGLAWEGATAVYRFDPADGNWHYVPPSHTSVDPKDRVFQRLLAIYGENTVVELLAVTAVKQVLAGNIDYWRLIASRIDQMKDESS